MEHKTLPFILKQTDSLLSGVIESYAAFMGNVDDGDDVIDHGAFAKTITENGARVKMGWLHKEPFGVTTYIAEVSPDALPDTVLARAPQATGGLFVRGQADLTAEDADRLKRLASGSVDEFSIGYEAVKAAFEQVEAKCMRRLKEVKLLEWLPVWVAMNPAAVVTGVKGREDEGGALNPPNPPGACKGGSRRRTRRWSWQTSCSWSSTAECSAPTRHPRPRSGSLSSPLRLGRAA